MKINRKSVIVAIAVVVIVAVAFFGGVKYGKNQSADSACIYTSEDITGAYNVGYEDGLHDASNIF